MTDPAQRYPLTWPAGWRRTPAASRRRAAFRAGGEQTVDHTGRMLRRPQRELTIAEAIARLSDELRLLGATEELLSTNVATRLDGLPRSGLSNPADPGAAVYFRLEGKPRCLACDRWDRVAGNIAAIAAHVDALRRIERYGVGTLAQAFEGYTALAPTWLDWWLVLGVKQDATLDQVEEAFRRLAREHHPDVGGDHDRMAELTRARDAAREVLRARG